MPAYVDSRTRLAIGLLLTLLAGGIVSAQSQGVVVEAVPRGGSGERAGLQPGDVLLSWTRAANPPANPQPATGEFRSFFDVVEVLLEQAPRGAVEVQCLRDGRPLAARLSEVRPWFQVRPQLPPDLLADYEAGRSLLSEGRVDETLTRWRAVLLPPDGRLEPESAASILFAAAQELRDQNRLAGVSLLHEEALKQARLGVRPHVLALALQTLAESLGGGAGTRTLDLAREAISVREAQASDSLALAEALNSVTQPLNTSGLIEAARAERRRADELIYRLAPGSLLAERQRFVQVPILYARGDLEAAEALGRQVLKRVEELAPDSADLGRMLAFMAAVVQQRGSIEGEAMAERAIAIAERAGREGAVLSPLTNLGSGKLDRGDLEGAALVLRRADEIYGRIHPESAGHAFVLNNLGEVQAARGDWAAAEPLFARSARILEAGGWATFQRAQVLTNLGRTELALGRFDSAERRLQQAVELHEKSFAGSPAHAQTLGAQGELAESRGDWERASALRARALELLERSGVGGAALAAPLYRMGVVARERGDGAGALARMQRALATIEAVSGRVAASDMGRATFSALHGGLYRETIDLLVELGRPDDAFALLERWRARWLLASLAERDLDFGLDVPAELEAERRGQERRYAEIRAALSQPADSHSVAEGDRLRAEMARLLEQGQRLAERVRHASPRFAALRYPQALDLAGVQTSLDPGSALLAYSVGRTRTLLFIVTARGPEGAAKFAHHALPVGEGELRARVTAFGNLLQRRPAAPVAEPELRRASRELFDLLLAPAAGAIQGARHVLLSPDGPLHTLPFAALMRPAAGGSKERYVVEWRPFTLTASATLRAQLRTRPAGTGTDRVALAAFGDPASDPDAPAGAHLRTRVARVGLGLERLPAARVEAERLARDFGASARAFVQAEANEANVQSVSARAERLHFACHGLLDPRSPLNSALVLAPQPGATAPAGDGLLEAWEVLERVRLHADLVTLSACETGLGQDLGGEGLGSLTRAFLYAGARSVVASLWSVADESTAELMAAFYRELRAGTPKNEALRSAQARLLRGRHRHPFHWAAFQLHGDSR